jgi:hypothetical protein
MHVHSVGRRVALAVSALSVVGVLAVCSATATAARVASTPHLAGTWSGTYGGAFSGTFTIHWRQTGSKLRGSIALSRPKGTYSITGSVSGSKIRFGAVGAGATYTGSASGSSMSGSYKTAQGGGSWSATKSS